MHGCCQADTFRTDMSFKQLLRKGTLGDLRERVSPDRDSSAGGSMPAGDQSAPPVRSTRVLYVTGDARESRIVSGAFTHSHPHLDFDFSVELARVRAHLSGAHQHQVLVGKGGAQLDRAAARGDPHHVAGRQAEPCNVERIHLDSRLRFHRIDNLKSIALAKSRWEYSYRLVVRAPFEAVLKH